MNIKKQIFITFFATIFFTAPLLKGMEFDFQKFYKAEIKTLDLTHMKITLDFLNKHKDSLQIFIFKNAVQKLDLQGNGLKQISVRLGTILLEEHTPLKEINIVFPKLSVGIRGLQEIQKFYNREKTLQEVCKTLKLNLQTTVDFKDNKRLFTLTKK